MLLFVIAAPIFMTQQKAEAAPGDSLRGTMMRLDRMGASAALSGTVCAKISVANTAQTEDRVVVTFPTGFTVNSTVGNFSINTAPNSSWPTTGTTAPWPGMGTTAMAISGTAVTMVSSDLASTAPWYCFNFTGASSTNTATPGDNLTGTVTTKTTGGTVVNDTATYATSIVGANNDTITVTATVTPNFSFLLSGTADTFTANLSTTTASTSGKTLTVATNASNGWTAWVKSANAALNSAAASATIATAGTINGTPTDLASIEGYVLDVNTGTGTPTIAGEYDGTNTTSGGTLSTSFQQIASGAAPTATDTVTLIERAKILATQKAANDYTDTLTVVAAGLY